MIDYKLPAGWFPVDEEDSVRLHAELQRELPAGHILYRKAVTVVADRDGATDDILCRHDDDPSRFTVVHLTWSGTAEYGTDYPSVECDGDFDTFLEYEAGFFKKSQ